MTLKNTDIYDITIYNKQTFDGREEVIEEKNEGSFIIKNKKVYILYKSTDDGVETSSMLTVSDDGVHLKKRGNVSSDMYYKRNAKTIFMYKLPFGSIEMEIDTVRIINALTEEGGNLRIVYTLTAQGEKYYNDMKITVSKR